MYEYARDLAFEEAALIRDEIHFFKEEMFKQ